ncbi:glycoside hydrolase family 26 protein [Streptomyces sp. NPDC056716]|uniref:glycoside hydrolase family 26 protein n=1 Tax=unclassified Streptomyces TaxID=2593676 RepID=UPI00368AF65D
MAPQQQRRSRSRRVALIAATVAASAALASGPVFAAGLGVVVVADPPAPEPAAAAPPPTGPAGQSGEAGQSGKAGQSAAPVAGSQEAAEEPAKGPAGEPVKGVGEEPVKEAVKESADVPVQDIPAFGAYLDYGPRGVSRIAELSRWLGGADLRVGHTYLPGDLWSNIEGRPEFLQPWADWRRADADRMFVLNVPMLERNEEGVSDAEVRRLLRQGAAGAFDQHYRALAERLVELKVPDTVIVLGWEMNGITYTHRCGPDPQAWKKYWNRIVTTMRAVPGQQFKFDWTPSRGRDAVAWTRCYPGDDTVDIIGMDSYDQPSGMSFDQQISEPFGLRDHVEFAKEHGKAISYPEWGLFRNGDNPDYMRRMLAWMDEHKPLYNTLTDYCPHGVWQCENNPRASEVYRSVLSGRGGPVTEPVPQPTPEPTPVPTPVPTPQPTPQPTPVDPPRCSPLELGDWVEHWLGGKLCVRLDWWSRSR